MINFYLSPLDVAVNGATENATCSDFKANAEIMYIPTTSIPVKSAKRLSLLITSFLLTADMWNSLQEYFKTDNVAGSPAAVKDVIDASYTEGILIKL